MQETVKVYSYMPVNARTSSCPVRHRCGTLDRRTVGVSWGELGWKKIKIRNRIQPRPRDHWRWRRRYFDAKTDVLGQNKKSNPLSCRKVCARTQVRRKLYHRTHCAHYYNSQRCVCVSFSREHPSLSPRRTAARQSEDSFCHRGPQETSPAGRALAPNR